MFSVFRSLARGWCGPGGCSTPTVAMACSTITFPARPRRQRHVAIDRIRQRLPILLLQHRARSTPTRLSSILDLPPELRAGFGTPVELQLLVDDLSGSVLDDPHADEHTLAFVELTRALLQLRELPLPTSLRERILATKDAAQLEQWFRRALAAASLDEVFTANDTMAALG